MQTLREHWAWIIGCLAVLTLIYWGFRCASLAYGRRVSKQLESFIEPSHQPVAATLLPPLPATSSSDNEVLANEKLKIWQSLHTRTLPAERLVESLIHELALARLDKIFATIYLRIYRSQHVLLKVTAESGGSISRVDVENFLASLVVKDENLKDVQFDRWIGFLAAENLIVATVNSFQITPLGREFLVWTIRNHLADPANGF